MQLKILTDFNSLHCDVPIRCHCIFLSLLIHVALPGYSQWSCNCRFQDGRPIDSLVEELKSGVLTTEHQNLLLSGYDAHEPSGRRIVKCINNRRLLALKRFSADHPFPIQVRVRIIPHGEALVRNSDRTDGVDIVVQDRQSPRMGCSDSWQHSPRSARSNSDRSGRNSERSGQW